MFFQYIFRTFLACLICGLASTNVFAADRQELIQRLYIKAIIALEKDHLTSPAYANAHDYFNAILAMDKGNPRAKEGLARIVRRYTTIIDQSSASGDYHRAVKMFNRAMHFFPGNKQLKSRGIKISKQRVELRRNYIAEIGNLEKTNFVVPKGAMHRNSSLATLIFDAVAQRIKVSDELVLLKARSDSEGRWMYKMLKKSAQGFRVRGDIAISKTPTIELLSPLDE